MAKKGRSSWWSKLTPAAAERIKEAIRAGEACHSIFTRFDIERFGITLKHFRLYHYNRIRRDWELRNEPPSPQDRSENAATLLQSIIDSMQISLDAGRPIDSKLSVAMSSVVQTLKLDISREADRRAEEKHKALMAKLTPRVNEAVERVTESGKKTPTREEILREIGKALRGEE